jgi:hypothetical protein
MTRAELLEAAKQAKLLPLPIRESPALRACVEAFWTQIADALERGKLCHQATKEAAQAYKLSLPSMSSMDGVRDYIDAIANGVCLGVFDGKEASTLLYAAQVSISVIHKQSQGEQNPAKRWKATA